MILFSLIRMEILSNIHTYVVYVPIIVQNQMGFYNCTLIVIFCIDGAISIVYMFLESNSEFRVGSNFCNVIPLCKIAKTVFHPLKWILAHFSEIEKYVDHLVTQWSNFMLILKQLIKKNWGAKYQIWILTEDYSLSLFQKGTTKPKKNNFKKC